MMNFLNIIMLPTFACNAQCDYCFINTKGKIFLSIENLKYIFLKIKEYCQRKNISKIYFFWQGGEILLMGVEWLWTMSKISEKVFQRSGIYYSHSIQSNLLLYNKEIKDLIKNVFNKTISSSLDFPNTYRKLNNKNNYETVWLEKYYDAINDGIKVNVISLLNSESIKTNPLDFYNYYIGKGIKIFQINLPHTSGIDKNKTKYFKLDIEVTKNFFSSLMEIWLSKKDNDDSIINPFNYFISIKTNGLKDIGCVWSYQCVTNFISISPLGDISLCDCFNVNYPEYILGNIFKDNLNDILISQKRKKIINRILNIVEEDCGNCQYLFLCHGGYPIHALSLNGDINKKDYYCHVYKKIFEISLNYMMLQSIK